MEGASNVLPTVTQNSCYLSDVHSTTVWSAICDKNRPGARKTYRYREPEYEKRV